MNKVQDRNELVKLCEEHPDQVANYINKVSTRDKQQLLVILCNTSKNAAVSFFKQNPSYGTFILRCGEIKLQIQTEIANIMKEKCDKNSREYKAAAEFLGKFEIATKRESINFVG